MLVASACGSTTDTVDSAAEAAPVDAVTTTVVVDDAAAEVDANESVAETTTTTPESTLLPSGRERILANHTEGKPYVLWYWGAH